MSTTDSNAVNRPAMIAVSAIIAMSASPVCLAGFPLVTEDTGTRGRGNGKLEFVIERARDRGPAQNERSGIAELSVSYGIRGNLDLSLGWQYRRVESANRVDSGPGDTSMAIKWRFYEDNRSSLAMKVKWSDPADAAIDAGSGAVSLVGSRKYRYTELLLDAGLSHTRGEDTQRRNLLHLSVGLERKIANGMRLVAETGLVTDPGRDSDAYPVFATLGFAWQLTDRSQLKSGVRFGLSDPATDLVLLAGVSRLF